MIHHCGLTYLAQQYSSEFEKTYLSPVGSSSDEDGGIDEIVVESESNVDGDGEENIPFSNDAKASGSTGHALDLTGSTLIFL